MQPAGQGSRGRRFPGAVLFVVIALAYVGAGLLPGRVLVPLDLLNDDGPWKSNPGDRAPVSNRLLTDPVVQFYPWDVQARRALQRGGIPWTNPFAAQGEPLFANPQAALLSPFTWPRLLVGDPGWAISVLLKLVVGALGVAAFALALHASARAAALSGIVFMLSGYMIVWGLHPHTNVLPLLPWLGLFAYRVLVRPTRWVVAGIIVAAALATAGGHPETLAFGVCGLAAFLVLETRARGPASSKRPAVTAAISAAAVGFLLVGVQLIPFALLLKDSGFVDERAAWGASGPRTFAMLGQVLPGLLGAPLEHEIDVSPAFHRAENFNLRNEGYVGLVALACLVSASRRLPASYRRGLAVAAVALAVAWHLPPFGWIWHRIPLVSLFAPEYAIVVFVLFGSLAVGPALEILVADPPGKWLRRLGVLLLAGGVLLVTAGIFPFTPLGGDAVEARARRGVGRLQERGHLALPTSTYQERLPDYIRRVRMVAVRRYAMPGLCWIFGGVVLLSRRPRFLPMSAALVAELVVFGFGYLPAVRRSRIPRAPPAITDLKRFTATQAVLIAGGEGAYSPDLPTLEELRDIRSFSLVESRGWTQRLAACGYDARAKAFADTLSAESSACLVAEGVRYYVSRQEQALAPRVGGEAPPGVGVYDLSASARATPPVSGPPRGFFVGVLVSLMSAMAATVLVFRFPKR